MYFIFPNLVLRLNETKRTIRKGQFKNKEEEEILEATFIQIHNGRINNDNGKVGNKTKKIPEVIIFILEFLSL